jgi:DNA-directed RNA polymerase specialized sigma24 family protein
VVNQIEPWVNQSAAATARAYSTWTSFPDVRQHLWSWAYANEKRVREYLTHQDGERIIRSILNREARNYAIKERATMTGYSPEDVAWYSITAIRNILPDVFDHEDWQTSEVGSGGRGSKPTSWGGDKLAAIIDVKGAMNTLPADRVALLREHFANGTTTEVCAVMFDLNVETVRKRIQRALKYISNQLNNPRPADPMEGVTYEEWSKSKHFYDTRGKFRRAMSNAAARKATEF